MRRVIIHYFSPALMIKKIVPDMLALIGLALLGYGLFLLFGLGLACAAEGALLLAGGVKMGLHQ